MDFELTINQINTENRKIVLNYASDSQNEISQDKNENTESNNEDNTGSK